MFRSAPHLKDAVQCSIDGWNAKKHPFVWVKTADHILVQHVRNSLLVGGPRLEISLARVKLQAISGVLH